MGYPMYWRRMVNRNGLQGDYDSTPHNNIKGDLRRVEKDSRDPLHLALYARVAGITVEQAKAVLDAFFEGPPQWTDFLTEEEIRTLYEASVWPEGRP